MRLQDPSHKALGVEHPRHPESFGVDFHQPRSDELDPFNQVGYPGAQWLQTGVALPQDRDFVFEEGLVHDFQGVGHGDYTFEG